MKLCQSVQGGKEFSGGERTQLITLGVKSSNVNMGYKAPILVCVLYLLGSICFVVGIVSPSWSYTIYNSASVTVGIWTQCYKDGQLDCVPPVQGMSFQSCSMLYHFPCKLNIPCVCPIHPVV